MAAEKIGHATPRGPRELIWPNDDPRNVWRDAKGRIAQSTDVRRSRSTEARQAASGQKEKPGYGDRGNVRRKK